MTTPEEIREIVREIIRDELASLTPADIPVYRVLARRREDLGWTQEQAGKEMGYSTSTIGSWDTGRMSLSGAEEYARYLGLKLTWVLTRIDPNDGVPLVMEDITEQRSARVRRRSR